jgi:hypothetical protein
MKSMTASHDTAPSGSSLGSSSVIVSASLSSPKTFPRCRNETLTGSLTMILPPGGKRTRPPFPHAFAIHHASSFRLSTLSSNRMILSRQPCRFGFEPTATYRECLDITLSCVASSIEVIGSGSSGLQKRQVYGGGRLCYSARRSNTRGRGA